MHKRNPFIDSPLKTASFGLRWTTGSRPPPVQLVSELLLAREILQNANGFLAKAYLHRREKKDREFCK